jgi:hypothetical protein
MLSAMFRRTGWLAPFAVSCLLTIACGAPGGGTAAQSSAAPTAGPSASPTALRYLRPVDGVTYTPMAADVEARVVATFRDSAVTYAIRDVAMKGASGKLRIVVLWMTDKYAATKPLNDVTGMGGPASRPDKKTIGGISTFFHTDVSPNILAWQQGPILALIYGDGPDRPAMEQLAGALIAADR